MFPFFFFWEKLCFPNIFNENLFEPISGFWCVVFKAFFWGGGYMLLNVINKCVSIKYESC